VARAQVRVNYNEAEFLKGAMKASKEDKPKGPRLTKMPQLNDFQFFNTKRIEELYAIEHAHETWKYQQHHRRLELEKGNATPEEIEAQLNKCARLRPLHLLLL
jgi:HAND